MTELKFYLNKWEWILGGIALNDTSFFSYIS